MSRDVGEKLVPSHLGLVETNPYPKLVVFLSDSAPRTSIPMFFLDLILLFKHKHEFQFQNGQSIRML